MFGPGPIPIEVRMEPPDAGARLAITADGALLPHEGTGPYRARWDGAADGTATSLSLSAIATAADGAQVSALRSVRILRIDRSLDVSLVLAPVLALDRDGHAVLDLEPDDFRLRVDGRVTPISDVRRGDAPVRLAIAIDASASMMGERLAAAVDAAKLLVARLGESDRALIIGFDHRPHLYTALTGDHGELVRGLDAVRSGGGTSLYDALALAIDVLDHEPGRKAIVLLTDGADSMSRTPPGTIERRARSAEIVLYSVRVGEAGGARGNGAEERDARERALRALVEDTGGKSLAAATAAEVRAGYQAIFEEMRAQYTVEFAPPAPADGRFHRIEIKVTRPRVRVRARRGFYAEIPPS